jgi:hypothetical protein
MVDLRGKASELLDSYYNKLNMKMIEDVAQAYYIIYNAYLRPNTIKNLVSYKLYVDFDYYTFNYYNFCYKLKIEPCQPLRLIEDFDFSTYITNQTIEKLAGLSQSGMYPITFLEDGIQVSILVNSIKIADLIFKGESNEI